MKTTLRTLTFLGVFGVAGLVLGARPAQAQVSLGIATPGFALGVGPGVGYVGGGYYPGYPVVAPAPVIVAPPVYAPRPFYGGYGYGYGYGPRPYPGYYHGGGGYYGPHRGYGGPYRR